MEGFIEQGFIQELPYGIPIEKALDDGMQYLFIEIPRVTNWLEVWFTPHHKFIDHQIFILSEGPTASIGFVVSQQATFLSDFVSAIIQLYGGINMVDDTIMLTFIKRFIYELIIIFIDLCSLRLTLAMWLIINPYTLPWFVLVTATEWFTEALSGIFPAFFGIEVSGTLLLTILANIANYIKNLVFTMPYLPSERIATTIGKHEVYKFEGLPKLWLQYEIPDELREEWFTNRRDILDMLIKNYGHENINDKLQIDFLPSHIIEEFYKLKFGGLIDIQFFLNDLITNYFVHLP